MKATILLEYDDVEMAVAVANAVSPDNLKAPAGLKVKTQRQSGSVVSEIEIDEKIATFIATIDDLLESASTAEKILRTIKK